MIALILLLSPAALAGPAWTTQNTLQKRGSELFVVCTGYGSNLAKARVQAAASCVEAAAAQLPTVYQVSSDARETDVDVTLQKQVLADQRIEGLNCEAQNEYIEDEGGNVKVWTKCRFDLSLAKSVPLNLERLTTGRAITVKTVPACTRLTIIGGPYNRHVPCEGDHTSVTLIPGEQTIAVHKQGYYVKEMKIQEEVTYQSVTLFLDKIGK